jgi:hypothetical protein
MANTFGEFDIADINDDGVIDTVAMTQGNLENITYRTSSAVGTWSSCSPECSLAYFGPYISYDVTVADVNGDGEPDFVNPTVAYQQNTSDSAGGSTSSFWLNFPTTVQVTLSDGSGGHVSPLSYEAGRRPNIAVVGQLAGSASSAPDIVVGHSSYDFGSWIDNLGWDGQYDYVTVVEMDNKDIAVTDIEISPVDRFFGVVGEGTRDINVTVTNTGMDTLTQSATLDVELKVVDEVNGFSTNTSTKLQCGTLNQTNQEGRPTETTILTSQQTIKIQPTSCGLANTRQTAAVTNGLDTVVTGMMRLHSKMLI